MKRPAFPLRAVAVLVAVAAGVLLAPSAANAAESPLPGPVFYADSGDNCVSGLTHGLLRWNTYPVPQRAAWAVDVKGILLDRPAPNDVDYVCKADDGRFTVATFTAYDGSVVADTEVLKADNEQSPIGFTLGSQIAVPDKAMPIDRVVVQVCRTSRYSITNVWPPRYDYCGKPQEYRYLPLPTL